MTGTTLWRYLRRDKKHVSGWLQRTDAEIIGAILQFQERRAAKGGCVEIGVHHGKSFIPLCLALRDGEAALCIDLFEDQHHNLDGSGKGDREVFQSNLQRFHIDPLQVRIFSGSSEDVTPSYVLGQVGSVRYFSIDGGHWSSIVQSDLRLAEGVIGEWGVIGLDDYCRAEWPDVTFGYAIWQNQTTSDIVPFAIGSNKLYLCRRGHAAEYRKALDTPFLAQYLCKTYRTDRAEIDCYRVEPIAQDEESLFRVLSLTMKIFRPGLFRLLKSRLRKL